MAKCVSGWAVGQKYKILTKTKATGFLGSVSQRARPCLVKGKRKGARLNTEAGGFKLSYTQLWFWKGTKQRQKVCKLLSSGNSGPKEAGTKTCLSERN